MHVDPRYININITYFSTQVQAVRRMIQSKTCFHRMKNSLMLQYDHFQHLKLYNHLMLFDEAVHTRTKIIPMSWSYNWGIMRDFAHVALAVDLLGLLVYSVQPEYRYNLGNALELLNNTRNTLLNGLIMYGVRESSKSEKQLKSICVNMTAEEIKSYSHSLLVHYSSELEQQGRACSGTARHICMEFMTIINATRGHVLQ